MYIHIFKCQLNCRTGNLRPSLDSKRMSCQSSTQAVQCHGAQFPLGQVHTSVRLRGSLWQAHNLFVPGQSGGQVVVEHGLAVWIPLNGLEEALALVGGGAIWKRDTLIDRQIHTKFEKKKSPTRSAASRPPVGGL